jgi:N-methylhydantoinase A/oxoprolinase/acetone carboxylase beta subunit
MRHAMLGTTHYTNALLEGRNLNQVGLIRIGASASRVDSDRGLPITTELVREGLRVDVVGIPASPQRTTQQALQYVGRAFGHTEEYRALVALGASAAGQGAPASLGSGERDARAR